MENFTLEDATNLYGIDGWGAGYFAIGNEGNLIVKPTRDDSLKIDIKVAVDSLVSKGVHTPLLLRFPQVLESQVNDLCSSFGRATQEFGYNGRFRPVFPIKVNQTSAVVTELLRAGYKHGFGLEAGSKPELLAAIALDASPESIITCNGFKDRDYFRAAFRAAQLGRRIVVVIEKPFELGHYIALAKEHTVRPEVGFRVRLYARGSGKWEKSGGFTSKFGLNTSQLLEGIHELRAAGLLDQLKMFHFHLGSQITEIRRIKTAVKEAARIYAKARKMGVDIMYLNVGGGLGVDYDGSKTSSDASVNYTLQEYANDVVYNIKDVCNNENVPEPHIVSESGRALVAYHSMLVVDVLAEMGGLNGNSKPKVHPAEPNPKVVDELIYIDNNMTVKNFRELYHDAVEQRDELFALFNIGLVSLEQRATGEALFWRIAQKAVRHAKTQKYVADEFQDLEEVLHEKFVCNFSVFQSIPDHWALDQLFPVVPIHRLFERPTRRGTLVDITCDSDGEIDKFVDLKDIKKALELHPYQAGQPYYLGVLLIGAYQDVMGDLHNLFGSANEAHLIVGENGRVHTQLVRRGNVVRETLSVFGYDPMALVRQIETMVEARVKEGALKEKEGKMILQEYRAAFDAYTYLT